MDERPAAKLSVVGASTEPSLAKSSRKDRLKLREAERVLSVELPEEGSVYLGPSFMCDVANSLLLPADRRRLTDIGPVQSVSGAWLTFIRYDLFDILYLNFCKC